MPIDPSIAMGVRPLQLESPINALTQALQVQGLQRQNALGDMQLREQQSVADERGALRNFFQQSPNLNDPAIQSKLYGVAPTQAGGILKSVIDQQKAQQDIAESKAKTNKENVEASVKAMGAHRDLLSMVSNPQQAAAWIQAAYANPALAPIVSKFGTPEDMIARIPQDPAAFEQWKQQNAVGADKWLADQTAKRGQDITRQNSIDTNKTHVQTTAMTNATSRANNAATIAKDYAVAGMNPDGTAGAGALSPAAIENAAARYNLDGTLPPSMGRGSQGAMDLRKIQNRAAELAIATDPTQLRVNQLDAKSAAAALTQLSRAKTMASNFERTANANADLALGLSKQLDRTGMPILNAGLQYLRTNSGSPEAAQWAAANETFVNEYAKIMSGGMGSGPVTDSARAKAHGLLTTAMTPQQYEGNVRLLQKEMANRMKGFEDEEAAVRARLAGAPAPSPAPAAGVPDDIAAILKKHGGK
jgi:hypothetical protein